MHLRCDTGRRRHEDSTLSVAPRCVLPGSMLPGASCVGWYWRVSLISLRFSCSVPFVTSLCGFQCQVDDDDDDQSLEAWPYSRECRGHNPEKKKYVRNSLMSSSHLFLGLPIDLLVLYFEPGCASQPTGIPPLGIDFGSCQRVFLNSH